LKGRASTEDLTRRTEIRVLKQGRLIGIEMLTVYELRQKKDPHNPDEQYNINPEN
jgi:hypothetical protein